MEIVTGDPIIKYVYDARNQNFVVNHTIEDILDRKRTERYTNLATNSAVPARFFDAFLKTDTNSADSPAQAWQFIAKKLTRLELNPYESKYAVIYSCAMSLLILSGLSEGNGKVLNLADQYCRLLSGEERMAGNFFKDRIPKKVEQAFSENKQLEANIIYLSRNRNSRDINLYDVVVPGLEPGTSSM